MRAAASVSVVLSLSLSVVASAPRAPARLVADYNANTAPAGTATGFTLTLALEARRAMWYPEGPSKPGRELATLGEVNRTPTVPAPLIRIAVGTTVRASVRNLLDSTIVFHVPLTLNGATPGTTDSVVIAPGAQGDLTFTATIPGNYFYRARTDADLDRRLTIGGAMAGAIVVDAVRTPWPRDRVLVLLASTDSAAPNGTPLGRHIVFSINGRSWPNTERMPATVGDSVRWRIINANNDIHPMHLHGFYYHVDAITGQTPTPPGAAALPRDLMVVTQRMPPFTSMSMTWVPERPGNWLFHCHFQVHVARGAVIDLLDANVSKSPNDSHENHALTGMQGLVMGVVVAPRPGAKPEPDPARTPATRRLRLVAVQDSGFPENTPSMRFTLEDAGSRARGETGPGFSPPIVLERGKAVAITVVNNLREPTAVHWHGIELDPYHDGAPGFSGVGNRVSPLIAPGDSFVARFTPPRAGTFIYHSHVNEPIQHRAGLLGALIVVDSLGASDVDDATIFLKSARAGVRAQPTPVLDLNGQVNPDTVTLHVGRPARFRFISLALLNPNAVVILTSRPDSAAVLRADSLVLRWQPRAKDGADLPAEMRAPRAARQIIGMGETYDFEFTPQSPGILRIEVRGAGGGGLLGRVPIRVD
jgi:FtsP/CotA-like multicopper oxidase with cupredoxin domain